MADERRAEAAALVRKCSKISPDNHAVSDLLDKMVEKLVSGEKLDYVYPFNDSTERFFPFALLP